MCVCECKMISKLVITFYCLLVTFNYVSGLKQFRKDYSYFGEVDGWYKMQIIPAIWPDARLRCHLEGAVLASPLDRQQDQAMNIMIMRYGIKRPIFTGIHATFSKGDYSSIEGVPLSEIPQKWAPNEPDNVNNTESCIQQYPDGSLADVSCDVTLPYMCFKKYNKDVVNACGTVDPEYEFDARTGKCYKFHRTPRTWSRAFMACAAEGGHLVIINNETEVMVLKDLLARNPESKVIGNVKKDLIWIGFHDWGEHKDWRTVHGATIEKAGYTKFGPGEPNNAEIGEYCGATARTLELHDLGCHYYVASICETSPRVNVDVD